MTTRRQFLQRVLAGAAGAVAARIGLGNVKAGDDAASRTVLVIDENGETWGDAEYKTPTGPDVLYFDAPSMSEALEEATDAQLQQAVVNGIEWNQDDVDVIADLQLLIGKMQEDVGLDDSWLG